MAENTEISWTDHTFNSWIGCTKISPGCDNCYAARQDGFRHWTPAGWGAGQPRKRTKTWGQPVKWNATPFYECAECSKPDCSWRGEGDGQVCGACGGHVVPARRRVFCASLADVFDNEVPDEWRADLFDLIDATPNLDWLLLTKRIGNADVMVPPAWLKPGGWPKYVRLGASIVNQTEANRDIGKLVRLGCPNFLSMEPLLAPVTIPTLFMQVLDWVIVGGESGTGARPMHPAWARSLRDQCAAAGVPFHFKQWGEWAPWGQLLATTPNAMAEARKHVFDDGSESERFGKARNGRLLDGVTHDAFPEVPHV